jgi:cell division protein FtsQ
LARKSSSAAVQEELYPVPAQARERESFDAARLDDARLMDLEAEQESPFLRGQKRVAVRRGALPKNTVHWLKWVALAVIVATVLGIAASTLYGYGKHSWRFRIDSSDQIEIKGGPHVTHAQIMEVMGGDIGRNIFFVPLAQRKLQLEQIPWVQSASVMRFVPNRLSVEIHERTPVAFTRIGSHVSLIDAGGTLMELAPGNKQKYSFPVIAGMNSGEPLSTRTARMTNYNDLVRQLDASGAHYSQDLSEVDLSDPEDVRVVVNDPNGDVMIHLGTGNYLARYKIYVTHVQQWRQQFDKLESVDLRYDGQIIVNPDLQGMSHQATLTPAAARAAMAAGAKPAAIVNYEKYVNAPPPAVKKPAKSTKSAKTAPKRGRHARRVAARSKAAAQKKNGVTLARTTSSAAPVSIGPQPVKPAADSPSLHSAAAGAATATSSGSKKPSAAIRKETPQE